MADNNSYKAGHVTSLNFLEDEAQRATCLKVGRGQF
jgi:hypothetical protein